MQLKTLRIRKFQSIDDITIHFDKTGVFHLTGANNVGKSVVVKSIKALFLNVSTNQYKEFLRDDCATFVVEGLMWSGDTLKLSRGASDYYEWSFGGVAGRMDKTAGKVPPVVEKYVNMYTDNEKTKECLNIRLPRSVLPFVDTTAGDNYYLLQKALGTDEFLTSMKLGEKKRRETAREVKVVTEYKDKEEAKLGKIEGEVSEQRVRLEKVEKYESVLKKEYETFGAIEDVARLVQEVQKSKDALQEAKENLKEINMDELREELGNLREIEEVLSLMKSMVVSSRSMKEVKDKIDAYDADAVKAALGEYKLVDDTLVAAKELNRVRKQTEEAKLVYEESDVELVEFMRENKFCPIVAKTLNKQCPFTTGEGIAI